MRLSVPTARQMDSNANPLHEIQTEMSRRQSPNEETSIPKTTWATRTA
jgi:hypothetical protein